MLPVERSTAPSGFSGYHRVMMWCQACPRVSRKDKPNDGKEMISIQIEPQMAKYGAFGTPDFTRAGSEVVM